VAADLARVKVARGEDFFARWVMGPETYTRLSGDGPLHTDDRRQFEFWLPQVMTIPLGLRLERFWQAILSRHEPATALVKDAGEEMKKRLVRFDRVRTLYSRAYLNSIDKGKEASQEPVIQLWENVLLVCEDHYPRELALEYLSTMLRLRANFSFKAGEEEAAVADLERAFELAPENVAAADRLIDLIVYRLYGLTEEEIAIVEGRSE